jgi:hypothetical protein
MYCLLLIGQTYWSVTRIFRAAGRIGLRWCTTSVADVLLIFYMELGDQSNLLSALFGVFDVAHECFGGVL